MLEKITRAMTIGVLALLLTGCIDAPKTNDKDVEPMPIEKYDELIASGKHKVILLDVRPEKSFLAEHIAGALNIPLPDIIAGDPRLAEATDIVTCDDGYIDPLGTAAAKRLIALRYSNVADLKGGLEAWKSLGREVVKGK